MRPSEIEGWAYSVIKRVQAGQPIEDVRVELKSEWPKEEHGAARRIAGHANGAHGEPILWLIGVDERKKQVVGADYVELATWWSKVQALFVELPPGMTPVNIPYDGKTVAALLFETEQRPFVVKVPGGGHIDAEVPWRDGTRIRSAKRRELITILAAASVNPSVEVLGGALHLSEKQGHRYKGTHQLTLYLYIVPHSQDRVVVPFHKCNAHLEFTGCPTVFPFRAFSFQDQSSPLISCSGNELSMEGPGKVGVTGTPPDIDAIPDDLWNSSCVQVKLSLWPTRSEVPVAVVVQLLKQETPPGAFRKYGVALRSNG